MSRALKTYRNAEGDIERICRDAGASLQRVMEDDHGWDILAEFPSRIETAFPDVDPPLTRCLIQVKSVQTRRKSTRVKVSNALKFAKDSLPCFVALVTYPNGSKAREAIYLRHIWATDMAEALKAARQHSAEGIALNRRHLTIAFTCAERVDDDFADALLAAIGREGADYAENKKRMADSLGYEEGHGEGQFVLADGHNEQDLQDLMLGRRADLPIESFTITEARFGIPGPIKTMGPGRLSVDVKPTARCVVTLRRRGSGEELSWPGGVFLSGMDWLPLADRKIRICAGPFEFLLAPEGAVAAHWEAPLDAPRSLDELEREARFRSWMDGTTVDLEIWSEHGEMRSGTVVFELQGDEAKWTEIIEAIRALSRVVPPERRPDDLRVSMNAFLRDQALHSHLNAMLNSAPTSIRVVNEAGLNPALQAATHIIVPWVSRLGEYFIVAVIEREIIAANWQETTLNLTTKTGRLLRGTVMKASGATDALVANEVEWARARAEASDRKTLSYHPDGTGSGSLLFSTPD